MLNDTELSRGKGSNDEWWCFPAFSVSVRVPGENVLAGTLGVWGFQQGSAGWLWHCCPLVPRWLLPREPWWAFTATRASSACSVSFYPAKNSLNLTFPEGGEAGFPCVLLPSLLSIGGLCCRHSRRCCWSCRQVSSLEFW